MQDALIADVEAGTEAVRLFKAKQFAEALPFFDQFLAVNTKDKVGYGNRAAALIELKRFSDALTDAEVCVRLDHAWAKGYKRQADALEGLGKQREAMEVLLRGAKECNEGFDIFESQLLRLNDELGGYIDGFRENLRRRTGEQWCAVCCKFEGGFCSPHQVRTGFGSLAARGWLRLPQCLFSLCRHRAGAEPDPDPCQAVMSPSSRAAFVACHRCHLVSYCSAEHKKSDAHAHGSVCGRLQAVRKWREKSLRVGIALGPNDSKMPCLMLYKLDMNTHQSYPLIGIKGFKPISLSYRKALNDWDACFALPQMSDVLSASRKIEQHFLDEREKVRSGLSTETLPLVYDDPEQMVQDMRMVLTDTLTDALTLFHALRKTGVWRDSVDVFERSSNDLIARIHVVGAETKRELYNSPCFLRALVCLFGEKPPRMHIELIGELLPMGPDQDRTLTDTDSQLTTSHFSGSYQEYFQCARYSKPDCIVAFFPGLYDPTYPWMGVIAHAIAKKIPFIATCSTVLDYKETRDFLVGRHGLYGMKANILMSEENPFASELHEQCPAGSNELRIRNQFVVVFEGGDLGDDVEVMASNARHAERVRQKYKRHLASIRSKFDFSGFCADLIRLRQNGVL